MAKEMNKTDSETMANKELVSQYQAIGPAAILAALLCSAPRDRVTMPQPARKAA